MTRLSLISLRTNAGSVIESPLRAGAYFTFATTLVLAPFRFRYVLTSRPLAPVYGDFTDFLVFASDIFLIATLVLWGLTLILLPRRIETGPIFLSIPISGILVTSLFSVISSVDSALSVYNLVRLIILAGLYLYVINEIKSLGQVVFPIALQVLVQSIVGVGQYLGQRSLGLISLGEWVLDPSWSGVSVVSTESARALRAYGLTDHPNILGGCLAFGLLILVGWYINGKPKWYPLVSSVFALGAVALFLTFSRAAWLGLLVGMILLFEGLRKTQGRDAIYKWLGLMMAGLIIVLPFVWQNASFLGVRLDVGDSFTRITLEQRSVVERRELNAAANEIFVENALSGVGLGTFPSALADERPGARFDYQPPHFALLEVAAEIGIFGALFYFLAMVGPWIAVWVNRARLELTPSFLGISAALAAITIVGFFDYYTWLLAPGRIWQWLIWGLWASEYQFLLEKGKHA